MNREEFKHYVISKIPKYKHMGLLEDEEPFWIPEHREGYKASYFVVTKVVGTKVQSPNEPLREGFWGWCKRNMSKEPMCFMTDSSGDIEWWGFNTEQDAMLFLLKWA